MEMEGMKINEVYTIIEKDIGIYIMRVESLDVKDLMIYFEKAIYIDLIEDDECASSFDTDAVGLCLMDFCGPYTIEPASEKEKVFLTACTLVGKLIDPKPYLL